MLNNFLNYLAIKAEVYRLYYERLKRKKIGEAISGSL